MTSILLRVRSAILLGLLWAVAWAPIGVIAGLIVDADGKMDEPWIAVGAYPGMLCGVLYAVVRGRTTHGTTLRRALAWGAACGLLVSMIPWMVGTPSPDNPGWLFPVVSACITALSSVSAGVTEYLRMKRGRIDLGANTASHHPSHA